MLRLREALAASWDSETAYEAVQQAGNPAFGQCYPTSWVVQQYYPETEIIKGEVWTGKTDETHFWNGLLLSGDWYHIDFTWQQFPAGSVIKTFIVLDRENPGDGEATVQRCSLLLDRVRNYLRNLS